MLSATDPTFILPLADKHWGRVFSTETRFAKPTSSCALVYECFNSGGSFAYSVLDFHCCWIFSIKLYIIIVKRYTNLLWNISHVYFSDIKYTHNAVQPWLLSVFVIHLAELKLD